MIAEFIQVINRISIRMMVMQNGRPSCPPCEIHAMVPDKPAGARLLDTVAREMPGIRLVPSNMFQKAETQTRQTNEQRLVQFLKSMPSGTSMTVKEIIKVLRISGGVMNNIIADAKKPTMLRIILNSLNIQYTTERVGRTKIASFTRT